MGLCGGVLSFPKRVNVCWCFGSSTPTQHPLIYILSQASFHIYFFNFSFC